MKKRFILLSALLLFTVVGCSKSNWVQVGDIQVNKANVKVMKTSFTLIAFDQDSKMFEVETDVPINDALVEDVKNELKRIKGGVKSFQTKVVVYIDTIPIALPNMKEMDIPFKSDEDIITYTERIVDMVRPLQ